MNFSVEEAKQRVEQVDTATASTKVVAALVGTNAVLAQAAFREDVAAPQGAD